LLVCAADGTIMTIPDSPRNLAVYCKQAGSHGGSGYPLLRLVALVACGTRTIIDAVFSPISCGEQDCTRRLARSLRPGMMALLDRNFHVAALLGELAATEADLLVRIKSNRKPPVLLSAAAGRRAGPPGWCPPRTSRSGCTPARCTARPGWTASPGRVPG
jgi:hypothetical protein